MFTLKKKVLANIVIPSKLLFSFFCRGNIRKQRLRAFIITNGWSGWRSHIVFCFFYDLVDFFFYQNAGNLSLEYFDQHCSKGSKHFPVKKFCVSKGCLDLCVYIFINIYILKYKFSFEIILFLFFIQPPYCFQMFD